MREHQERLVKQICNCEVKNEISIKKCFCCCFQFEMTTTTGRTQEHAQQIVCLNKILTWIKLEMSIGNIDRGNLKMLKRDRETKAVSASNT